MRYIIGLIVIAFFMIYFLLKQNNEGGTSDTVQGGATSGEGGGGYAGGGSGGGGGAGEVEDPYCVFAPNDQGECGDGLFMREDGCCDYMQEAVDTNQALQNIGLDIGGDILINQAFESAKDKAKKALTNASDALLDRVAPEALDKTTTNMIQESAEKAGRKADDLIKKANVAQEAVDKAAEKARQKALKRAQALQKKLLGTAQNVSQEAVEKADKAVQEAVEKATKRLTKAANKAQQLALESAEQASKLANKAVTAVATRVARDAAEEAVKSAIEKAVKNLPDNVDPSDIKRILQDAANEATQQIAERMVREASAGIGDEALQRAILEASDRATKLGAEKATAEVLENATLEAAESAERAAREAAEKAAKEAAERAAREAAEGAAREAAEKAAKEAAELLLRDAFYSVLTRQIAEAAQRYAAGRVARLVAQRAVRRTATAIKGTYKFTAKLAAMAPRVAGKAANFVGKLLSPTPLSFDAAFIVLDLIDENGYDRVSFSLFTGDTVTPGKVFKELYKHEVYMTQQMVTERMETDYPLIFTPDLLFNELANGIEEANVWNKALKLQQTTVTEEAVTKVQSSEEWKEWIDSTIPDDVSLPEAIQTAFAADVATFYTTKANAVQAQVEADNQELLERALSNDGVAVNQFFEKVDLEMEKVMEKEETKTEIEAIFTSLQAKFPEEWSTYMENLTSVDETQEIALPINLQDKIKDEEENILNGLNDKDKAQRLYDALVQAATSEEQEWFELYHVKTRQKERHGIALSRKGADKWNAMHMDKWLKGGNDVPWYAWYTSEYDAVDETKAENRDLKKEFVKDGKTNKKRPVCLQVYYGSLIHACLRNNIKDKTSEELGVTFDLNSESKCIYSKEFCTELGVTNHTGSDCVLEGWQVALETILPVGTTGTRGVIRHGFRNSKAIQDAIKDPSKATDAARAFVNFGANPLLLGDEKDMASNKFFDASNRAGEACQGGDSNVGKCTFAAFEAAARAGQTLAEFVQSDVYVEAFRDAGEKTKTFLRGISTGNAWGDAALKIVGTGVGAVSQVASNMVPVASMSESLNTVIEECGSGDGGRCAGSMAASAAQTTVDVLDIVTGKRTVIALTDAGNELSSAISDIDTGNVAANIALDVLGGATGLAVNITGGALRGGLAFASLGATEWGQAAVDGFKQLIGQGPPKESAWSSRKPATGGVRLFKHDLYRDNRNSENWEWPSSFARPDHLYDKNETCETIKNDGKSVIDCYKDGRFLRPGEYKDLGGDYDIRGDMSSMDIGRGCEAEMYVQPDFKGDGWLVRNIGNTFWEVFKGECSVPRNPAAGWPYMKAFAMGAPFSSPSEAHCAHTCASDSKCDAFSYENGYCTKYKGGVYKVIKNPRTNTGRCRVKLRPKKFKGGTEIPVLSNMEQWPSEKNHFGDKVSSMKVRCDTVEPGVYVFNEENFKVKDQVHPEGLLFREGKYSDISRIKVNPGSSGGWVNNMKSMKVSPGCRVEFYTEKNFKHGVLACVGPGNHAKLTKLNGWEVHSMKVTCDGKSCGAANREREEALRRRTEIRVFREKDHKLKDRKGDKNGDAFGQGTTKLASKQRSDGNNSNDHWQGHISSIKVNNDNCRAVFEGKKDGNKRSQCFDWEKHSSVDLHWADQVTVTCDGKSCHEKSCDEKEIAYNKLINGNFFERLAANTTRALAPFCPWAKTSQSIQISKVKHACSASGWISKPGRHTVRSFDSQGNDYRVTRGMTADQCISIGLNKKWKAVGHRNSSHRDPNLRDTCFRYIDDSLKYERLLREGDPTDKVHKTYVLDESVCNMSERHRISKVKRLCSASGFAAGVKYNFDIHGNINRMTSGMSADECIAIGLKKKWKAVGHRNASHPVPASRNTCFQYKNGGIETWVKGGGHPNDKVHKTYVLDGKCT